MELAVIPGTFAIARLPADAEVPAWAVDPTSALTSVTRTPDELSVLVGEDSVPEGTNDVEPGWAALKVAGPLDFGLTGVLAELSSTLAAADVPIFVVSSFETDYILVKRALLEPARAALSEAGHTVVKQAEASRDDPR